MLKNITILFVSFQLIFLSSAFAAPVMKLKDLEVHMDTTEQFRFVSGKEQIVFKKISANHVTINGKSLKWNKNTTMAQFNEKAKVVYESSKKKSALLERLLINEAQAGFFLPFLLGGAIGAIAGGSLLCDDDGGRSTSSVKKKK